MSCQLVVFVCVCVCARACVCLRLHQITRRELKRALVICSSFSQTTIWDFFFQEREREENSYRSPVWQIVGFQSDFSVVFISSIPHCGIAYVYQSIFLLANFFQIRFCCIFTNVKDQHFFFYLYIFRGSKLWTNTKSIIHMVHYVWLALTIAVLQVTSSSPNGTRIST